MSAEQIDPILAPLDRSDEPGGIVGIAREGRVIYRRAFGLASVACSVANQPATRIRIGSATKPFTALALMLLVEEGRVGLDDDLRRHLPELHDYGVRLTPRHLLHHTSGLRCNLDLWSIGTGARARLPDGEPLRQLLRLRSLNFRPGERLIYSNGGYVLLAQLIERAAGMPFADFLDQRIFRPLGMTDTALRPRDEAQHPGDATLHVREPGGGFRRGEIRMPLGGEGGLVSNVDDLLRWLLQLATPTLGSAGSWREMRSGPCFADGSRGDYGLGLISRPYRGVTTVGHAGAVSGGASEMFTVPEHRLDVVVLANRADLGVKSLALRIVDAILAPLLAPPPRKPVAAACAGRTGLYHEAASGQLISIEVVDDAVHADFGGARAVLDSGGSDDELAFAGSLGDFRFHFRGDEAFDLIESGIVQRFRKLGDAPADTAGIAGRYCNAEMPAQVVVLRDETGWCLGIQTHHGRALYALTPLAPGLWSAQLADGSSAMRLLIEFEIAGAPAPRLLLSTMRTRRLAFARATDAASPLVGDWS